MITGWLTAGLMFVIAVCGLAAAYVNAHAVELEKASHERELAGVNKIGKWYQDRVAELEQENALLASQVVSLGTQPVRTAMPVSPYDPGYEYSYDPTGLIREQLDPREAQVG